MGELLRYDQLTPRDKRLCKAHEFWRFGNNYTVALQRSPANIRRRHCKLCFLLVELPTLSSNRWFLWMNFTLIMISNRKSALFSSLAYVFTASIPCETTQRLRDGSSFVDKFGAESLTKTRPKIGSDPSAGLWANNLIKDTKIVRNIFEHEVTYAPPLAQYTPTILGIFFVKFATYSG